VCTLMNGLLALPRRVNSAAEMKSRTNAAARHVLRRKRIIFNEGFITGAALSRR